MKSALNFLKNAKRWITLEKHPILHRIVYFIIHADLFNNRGKFKPGDKVKYNFFAKVYLGHKHIQSKGRYIFTIKCYEPWSKDLENVAFEEDSGCSVFWIRKLYPWERWAFFKKFSARTEL